MRLVLVIPFVLQIGVAVGLTGYFSWRNGQQTVNDLANRLIHEISDRVHLKLETYLEQPHQVNFLNATAVRSGHLNVQNTSDIQKHFWQKLQVFDSISSVYIGNAQGELCGIDRLPNGTLVLSTSLGQTNHAVSRYQLDSQGNQEQLIGVVPQVDMRQRPWFKTAATAGKATWSEIYPNYPDQKLGITAVYPVYDLSWQLQTVIASDLLLFEIDQFLERQNLGHSGQIFIMERSGKLVSTSTSDSVITDTDGNIERVTAATSENGVTRFVAKRLRESFSDFNQIQESQSFPISDEDGNRYFLRVSPLQDRYGLDWLIVMAVPESNFMQQINANFRITILLCAGSLVLAIALGFLTTNWIIGPILRLSRASRNLALGEWDYPVRQDSVIAELEVLARSYNQMAAQLNQSFDQVKIALQESEERFTKIFRTSPAPILIATFGEGRFLEANDSLFQFSGYSRDEVIGHTVLELGLWVNPEDRERYLQLIQQDGKIRQMECSVRIKSGEIKTMLLSAEVLELDGQMCVLAVGKDISDRKQLELALQTSEAKLNDILNSAVAAIASFRVFPDKIWEFDYVSAGCETLYGYTRAEFLADNTLWRSRVLPEDMSNVIKLVCERLFTERSMRVEYRFLRKDGCLRWIASSYSSRHDEIADCWIVTTIAIDITPLKQAEEALQRSEERYRAIVNTQTELIIRSTPQTIMTFVNEATCRLSGYTQEQLIGHPWQEFIDPADVEMTLSQVATLSMENSDFTLENRIKIADGQVHWFEWTNQGIFNDQGELVEIQSVGRNITKRKQAESALQQVNARLKAKVRDRTVDLLRIHHQLRRTTAKRTS